MNRLLGAIFTAALVAGCGSSKSGYHPADGGPDGGGDGAPCPTGGTGQLVLEMTGLPAGVTPMVRVSGGATPMLLMAGTPVTVNAGGGYVIETRRVKTAPAAGSVIGKAFQATTTFDGCVKPDATTTAMVTFVQEPGSDKLWATTVNPDPPHDQDPVGAFAGSDLAATAAKNPTVWLSMHTTGRGGGGAFDFYGNFWLPAGDRINMYAAATLGASNATPPGVTLTQPTSATATFAAFDADGNLWVTRSAPGTERSVVRYAADTLGSSTATPSVVITLGAAVNPRGLAFDASGALWVTDDEGEKLLKFAAGRLAASTSAAADVVITTKTPAGAPVQGPYTDPNPLAFDKTGNLWVGYAGNIVKLTPAQQTASADIAGPFSINVPGGTGAFAFDESGGLWISAAGGKIQRIAAAMLAGAGGDVTPDIVVTSAAVGGTENLVINPAPTWSIIHDAL
jgi:sugar lactone lactonase YvrE